MADRENRRVRGNVASTPGKTVLHTPDAPTSLSSNLRLGMMSQVQQSTSPYSSPEMLKAYRDAGFEEIVAKLIESVDREQQHRHKLENREHDRLDATVRYNFKIVRYGQIFQVTLGIFGTVGSVYLATILKSPVVPIVFFITAMGGSVAAQKIIDFFTGYFKRQKEVPAGKPKAT